MFKSSNGKTIFEAGDEVVFVDVKGCEGGISVGDRATVTKMMSTPDYVEVRGHSVRTPKAFFTNRFKLWEDEKVLPQDKESYTLKLSSPYLLDYGRLIKEVLVGGTKVAKVTVSIIVDGVKEDRFLLLIREDILATAEYREGGKEALDALSVLGCGIGNLNVLTIKEWATAYGLVKSLVKSPLLKQYRMDTTVTVEPLEV